MSRKTQFFPFDGGENLVDPVIMMTPGELHDSLNYENGTNGGYRRVDGFERYDGQLSPSEFDKASYVDLDAWVVAVEAARANILPLPGSGQVRGIWTYGGVTYGFRDNVAGTACIMYKSTLAGWVAVEHDLKIDFELGSNEIFVGDTLSGDTSLATATVAHIHLYSGDWATNDAVGEIHFHPDSYTGTFVSGEILDGSVNNSATSSSTAEPETFPAGGTYEFVNYNFYGGSGSVTMYGVNGVGEAFSFDGHDIIYIHSGMAVDQPNHIFAHKKHLFLSFPGGSVQHSSIGEPNEWNAITGASELAIGDECTGFASIPGDTLAIFARNKINLLYGTSTADWNLKSYSNDSGAISGSIQSMSVPFFLDDRGLKSMTTTADYGDFTMNTVSQKVKPKLDLLINQLNCSMRVRNKDQYRLFFDDGSVTIFAFDGGNIKGVTNAYYGKTFTAASSGEDSTGKELLFVGDEDGYVYRMDHGNSFDGNEVNAYIRPVFYHFSTPENIKRFMKVVLEMEASQSVDISFIPEFSYGDPYYPSASESDVEVRAGSGVWDESYWENFYWDSQSLSTAFGYMTGLGKTFRMIIKSIGTYEAPHTLQGATIHFTVKGYAK